MIVFFNIAEIVFVTLTVIRTIAFGIWTFKRVSKGSGIFIFLLCAIALYLFAFSLYKM